MLIWDKNNNQVASTSEYTSSFKPDNKNSIFREVKTETNQYTCKSSDRFVENNFWNQVFRSKINYSNGMKWSYSHYE